jgi:alcohol dehydrogenase (cytochrome c)
MMTLLSSQRFASAAPVAADADSEWPMFNQSYDGQRYSELKQINRDNVSQLQELCRVRVGDVGGFPVGPILVDGVMYLTFRDATVAVNPVDCGINWKVVHRPVKGGAPGGGPNRGVAYLDGHLYRGTGDGALLALDAATGRELWQVAAADRAAGEGLTSAPVIWNGRVFIGIAGSEVGVKGRILAFDAKDGKLLWQFHTVPQAGEFGNETWKDDSWRTGGGGTWSTFTLDPASGELLVPVGNPSPDFFLPARIGNSKLGQNLFTNSVVSLDAVSGKLKWWFQATPGDDRDLDQAAAPMLFNLANGSPALAAASKDGYLRVIDRSTHRLIYKVPTTTIRNQSGEIPESGLVTCPGVLGGTQWNGPVYDPAERSIVTGAVDWCSFIARTQAPQYERGRGFYGGRFQQVMDPTPSGWITSVESDSGRVRWRFHAPAPIVGALTPTAGGITFVGDMAGNFYALASSDGRVLLQAHTPGAIAGGNITYRIGGRQYVATTSGDLSRSAWGATGLPLIIVYALPDAVLPPPTAKNPSAESGRLVYARSCGGCHGEHGEGLSAPPLKSIGAKHSREELIAQIEHPRPAPGAQRATMPELYPAALSLQEVVDVAAYLETFR